MGAFGTAGLLVDFPGIVGGGGLNAPPAIGLGANMGGAPGLAASTGGFGLSAGTGAPEPLAMVEEGREVAGEMLGFGLVARTGGVALMALDAPPGAGGGARRTTGGGGGDAFGWGRSSR